MKISKKLIEKYHDGTCSADEKQAVENWLMSDDDHEQLLLPDEIKLKHSAEMWAEIASVLPGQEKVAISLKSNPYTISLWRKALAAAIILAALSSALYVFKRAPGEPDVIVMRNTSETINKNFNEREYTISIGPKSNVEINSQTGMVDFCGAMMINPKRDMELTIQGACVGNGAQSEKMILKKGLNYIALNYSSTINADEVIIVEEGSMMGLPPLVLKQLLHQFNI